MAPIKRVLLDLDAGSDDAWALLILLHAEKNHLIKIEGIFCTMGNTSVEHVCRNVVRILEKEQRTDIPIYKGATEQIIRPHRQIQTFHGVDGFGDLQHDSEPDVKIVQSDPAALGMYNIASKYSKEIYLICLGPLTNVALAMKLFPNFVNLVKEIYLMGGNSKAVGNVTRAAEYNFYVDPEAAHVVLNNAKCPINILTWETCLLSNISFDWRFNELGKIANETVLLLNKVEREIYKSRTEETWFPCDAFLAAAFVYPECIEEESKHHATVELHGHETRGQIVLDHLKEREFNVRIIEKINEGYFKNVLLNTTGHIYNTICH